MIQKKLFFILFVFFLCILEAKVDMVTIYEQIAEKIPATKVITITELKGNFADDFRRELTAYLVNTKNITVVDYDLHKMVLDENLRYSEPVFDDKYSDAMPQLVSPDISLFGSANQQKSNFLFKQREHLDYEVNIIEINTGIIIYSLNDRIITRYNPPILLLIILIVLILAAARWFIYLKKGYNVRYVLMGAMALITLIIVWFLV